MATCARAGCENELTGQQRKWCGENCRKRACEDRRRMSCPKCGRPMSAGSAWKGHTPDWCVDCARGRSDRAHQERIERVAAMYLAGKSLREIAEALGYKPTSRPGSELVEARRQGLIGYRNNGYGNAA